MKCQKTGQEINVGSLWLATTGETGAYGIVLAVGKKVAAVKLYTIHSSLEDYRCWDFCSANEYQLLVDSKTCEV